MRHNNVQQKIGTGRLSEKDALKLSKPRRCNRPLVGAMADQDRGCSQTALPFYAACQHHMTDAELDAAMLARTAFGLGVERGWRTEKGSPIWPDIQEYEPAKSDDELSPREKADQDAVRQRMENFRI